MDELLHSTYKNKNYDPVKRHEYHIRTYDPVKRHELYERTKLLKGRNNTIPPPNSQPANRPTGRKRLYSLEKGKGIKKRGKSGTGPVYGNNSHTLHDIKNNQTYKTGKKYVNAVMGTQVGTKQYYTIRRARGDSKIVAGIKAGRKWVYSRKSENTLGAAVNDERKKK